MNLSFLMFEFVANSKMQIFSGYAWQTVTSRGYDNPIDDKPDICSWHFRHVSIILIYITDKQQIHLTCIFSFHFQTSGLLSEILFGKKPKNLKIRKKDTSGVYMYSIQYTVYTVYLRKGGIFLKNRQNKARK